MPTDTDDEPYDPEGCETCGFETVELTQYYATLRTQTESGWEHRSWWICEVCAGTHIMDTLKYPRQHENDTRLILQAINLNTNLILQALKTRGSP